uniref:Uncharacterized protein n=1 Tax=Papilio polytes TaxID=76194 RepID=I4DMQ4_PAPPL|nr:unknown unsecreted protein [Papilio polytes]
MAGDMAVATAVTAATTVDMITAVTAVATVVIATVATVAMVVAVATAKMDTVAAVAAAAAAMAAAVAVRLQRPPPLPRRTLTPTLMENANNARYDLQTSRTRISTEVRLNLCRLAFAV